MGERKSDRAIRRQILIRPSMSTVRDDDVRRCRSEVEAVFPLPIKRTSCAPIIHPENSFENHREQTRTAGTAKAVPAVSRLFLMIFKAVFGMNDWCAESTFDG